MKIKRIALFLITIVCIFALFSFASSANTLGYGGRIFDDGDLISIEHEQKLEEKIQAAEEKCGVPIRIYTYEYSSFEGHRDMYDYESEVGESFDDLILLIISYEYGEYYYELFTKGSPDSDITDKEADKILDNKSVYKNIKSGNLYDGIDAYITLLETAVTGTLRNNFKSVLISSLVISAVVATAVAVWIILKYRKKLHSESYPLERYAKLDLVISNDNFITKTVTRTRVHTSSGSSGGGRSSGGGSRGRR